MTEKSKPRDNINVVLEAHDDELMRIPGVVGVYVGLLEDEKTECIKVMLSRPLEAPHKLPETIGGYRVVAEVTGEIRPLGDR